MVLFRDAIAGRHDVIPQNCIIYANISNNYVVSKPTCATILHGCWMFMEKPFSMVGLYFEMIPRIFRGKEK